MQTQIRLPEGWAVRKLGELCSKSLYGYTTKTSSAEIGPLILRITDICDFGNVDFNKVKFCKIEENELNKFLLEDGDILIARSGSIGKTYLHKDTGKKVIFASYLVRFKPSKELAEPKFLFYYLHSPDFSKISTHGIKKYQHLRFIRIKFISPTLRLPPKNPLPPA